MIRKIIQIDAEKCNGCGACVSACHEGAIGLKNGKAVLLRDDYCDGLGDCLPVCPTEAISFEEREALPYDEEAVQHNMQERQKQQLPCGCPGSMTRKLSVAPLQTTSIGEHNGTDQPYSCLQQWPVQLRLVPPNADFLAQADILIAADCTAFACASFHKQFMSGKVTLIGCPKLDDVDYADKLAAILSLNDIRSILVTKMSVPCCMEIAKATMRAIQKSGKTILLKVVTLSPEGAILDGPTEGNHHRHRSL